MSIDPFVQANNGPAPTSQAEADQQRADRVNMVEEARRVGEAQRTTRAAPSIKSGAVDYAALAPPGHPDPRAYVQEMAQRGGHNGNAPVLDTAKMTGALPVDNSILNECRSPMGFVCPASDLKADGTVSYKGLRMTAAQAVKEGLLEDNGRGGFQLPSGESVKAREDAAKQADEQAKAQAAGDVEAKRATGEECDAETQGAIDLVAKHVPGQAADALVSDYVSNGSLSEANVVKIAESLGWSGDQGRAVVTKVVAGLQRQAATAATSVGVPAHEIDGLWAWASQNYPIEQKNSATALVHANDVRGIKDLARKYMAHRRDAK
jgi:hypothetical protein